MDIENLDLDVVVGLVKQSLIGKGSEELFNEHLIRTLILDVLEQFQNLENKSLLIYVIFSSLISELVENTYSNIELEKLKNVH